MKKKHLIYGISIFAVALGMSVGLAGCEDEVSSAADFTLDYKIATGDTLELQSATNAKITAVPQPAGSSLKATSLEWVSQDPTIVTVNEWGIVVGVGDFTNDTTTVITVTANGITKTVPVKLLPLPLPPRKGSWLFDDPSDPYKAEVGNAIEPCKDRWPNFEHPTYDVSGHSVVDGPTSTNGAIQVKRNYSLFADHGLSPNGDGIDEPKRVNDYTVFFWVKFANATADMDGYENNDGWKPFMKIRRPLQDPSVETKGNNGDDFGLRIGARSWGWDEWNDGNIDGKMEGFDVTQWNRVLVTVKSGPGGFLRIYWNGNLVKDEGYNRPDYDRVSLDPEGLGLFTRGSDGDPSQKNEDITSVAELAIWDVTFNDALVSKLERSLNK
ncbi:hypothetical protein AGMMS49982_17180 [Bacteroidia bacterium]|nr:hypothetical protein AGMMS49982_17180 [Bacteroidia bacterium]